MGVFTAKIAMLDGVTHSLGAIGITSRNQRATDRCSFNPPPLNMPMARALT